MNIYSSDVPYQNSACIFGIYEHHCHATPWPPEPNLSGSRSSSSAQSETSESNIEATIPTYRIDLDPCLAASLTAQPSSRGRTEHVVRTPGTALSAEQALDALGAARDRGNKQVLGTAGTSSCRLALCVRRSSSAVAALPALFSVCPVYQRT
ncbi:hypothetical protein FKP32DRAFT_333474 [Trametes sanguinea]|nr:hypothetical protein FKP32DRAFT_333474 [Trametes sanguinea]